MPDIVRFKGHAITYDRAGLVLVPFVDRTTKEEHILIKRTEDDGVAAYLDELKTSQVLETKIPFDINHTYDNLDTDIEINEDYDPEFDEPEERLIPDQRTLVIVRVDANDQDNVRAVFSGTNDKIPVFVASSSSNVFNALDVGNLIKIHSSGRREVLDRVTETAARNVLHAQWDAYQKKQEEYKKVLGYGKIAYVERFLKGDMPEMFIDIFTVRGSTLQYTDTEIEILSKSGLEKVLMQLARRDVDKNTDVVMNQRRGRHQARREEDWYGFDKLFFDIVKTSGAVKINGVKVTYEEKTRMSKRKIAADSDETYEMEIVTEYVNGKRIARDDVEAVITHATCYREQARYDDYVQSVCKVSLKYHRAVMNGLVLNDHVTYRSAINEKGEVHLPNDYGDYGTKAVKISAARVKFRKEHGTKPQVFLVGEWRRVKSFDALVRALETKSRQKQRNIIHNVPMGVGASYHSALSRLSYVDTFLVEEDRIFKDGVHFNEWNDERKQGTKSAWGGWTERPSRGDFLATDEAKKLLAEIGKDYVDMFGISIKEQTDVLLRSKQLFDRIVKQEKVEVSKNEREYVVTGSSGKRYKVTVTGAVTDLTTNRHICIVNGGTRELGGWDYLASLIAALAHDNRTAKAVTTLKV
jgi:hypothetical protein